MEELAIAVALGTDAFSVAMALGIRKYTPLQIFKISLIIGVFHIFMPLLGFYGGNFLKSIISRYIAPGNAFELLGAGLLILLGVYMIFESRFGTGEMKAFSPGGWGIISLALGVSMDAMTAGIGLGIMGFSLTVVFLFGLVAAIMMGIGLLLGNRLGHWLGESAQIAGGSGLILLGLRFAGIL
ncbi:MAG: manganese efflux pump MntP family protein [Halanaerobiales bacterium]